MYSYVLIIIVVLILIFLYSRKRTEGFFQINPVFWNEVRTEFPPLHVETTEDGRYIMPNRYLNYGPYWLPPDRKPECISKTSYLDQNDDDILDKRKFF